MKQTDKTSERITEGAIGRLVYQTPKLTVIGSVVNLTYGSGSPGSDFVGDASNGSCVATGKDGESCFN